MKPTDVIEEGNKRLKEIYEEHKEFKAMNDLVQMTEDVTAVDNESLCAAASSMTAYLSYISGVIAKYTSLANAKYAYRKFSYAWEWNKLGDSFTGKRKDNEALERIEAEYVEGLTAQYVADFLKNKYNSFEKHTSVLQSRIGLLKNEMFRSNT